MVLASCAFLHQEAVHCGKRSVRLRRRRRVIDDTITVRQEKSYYRYSMYMYMNRQHGLVYRYCVLKLATMGVVVVVVVVSATRYTAVQYSLAGWLSLPSGK
jgi:hypothetical protein